MSTKKRGVPVRGYRLRTTTHDWHTETTPTMWEPSPDRPLSLYEQVYHDPDIYSAVLVRSGRKWKWFRRS